MQDQMRQNIRATEFFLDMVRKLLQKKKSHIKNY